jgi:putative ABC transport system permease protein
VAILTNRFWHSAFGGDSSVIGHSLSLDGRGFQIVGVMPAGMRYPDSDVDLWIPIGWSFAADPELKVNRSWHAFDCLVRLGSGTTMDRLRADLAVLATRIQEETMGAGGGQRLQLDIRGGGPGPRGGGPRMRGPGGPGGAPRIAFVTETLNHEVVGDTGSAILMLAGAVALVLLIACANAANLLIARASRRGREIAVRRALGADRVRLARQLLTESVVLALAGAAVGLVFARIGLGAVISTWPAVLPRANEIGIDGRVLGFTLLLSVITGVAFGMIPAVRASAPGLEQSLRDEAGASGGRTRRRTQAILIASEIALALVLLAGAGLLVRSFVALNHVDPGFDPRDVVAARVRLTPSRYNSPQAQQEFFDRLVTELRQRPGVTGAALARTLPLSGARMMLAINPREVRGDDPDQFLAIGMTVVGPDFFSTMKIPIVSGRPLTADDRDGQPRVAVINRRLAQRLWLGENPLGKTFPMGAGPGGAPGRGPVLVTVIGVIGDIRGGSLSDEAGPEVFLPVAQVGWRPESWLAIRSGQSVGLGTIVREAVATIDAQQPVAEIATIEQMVAQDQSARRLNTTLLTLFALLAVALAVIGIYGVTAYAVSQRTREFGLRVALGARPGDVVRLVVAENVWLVVTGIISGLIISLLASRVLASLLFGVGRNDVATFGATAVLLAVVALAATLIPARRATRVDPMVALRTE